jgi:hypothetical protein
MLKMKNDVIILIIIWITAVISFIVSVLNSYYIGLQSYVGYVILVVLSFLRIIRLKRFKTVLGIVLILGSLNVFQFTVSRIGLHLGPGESHFLDLQPLSLVLLIFFISFNYSECRQFIDDFFAEDPRITAQREKSVKAKHYNLLKNEKDERLQDIIENKNIYQVEYFNAAQRIMDERKPK